MKKYERYKDSGVQWLGKVPEHWEVMPMKYVLSCNDEVLDEKTSPSTEINYVEISDVNSVDGICNSTKVLFGDAPSRARRIVQEGDVIISTVRTYLKAIAPVRRNGYIVSTGFAVLRPRSINSDYLSYTVLSNAFIDSVIACSTGVSYPAITSTDLIALPISIPSLAEQIAIANYLDSQVSKINSVITEKETMINDMEKYRSSLISETVTKGLYPDAPMRDSGVDWIGEIPEHWSTRKLKYCLSEKLQYGASESGIDFRDDFPRYIRITDITQDGKLKDIDKLSLAPKVAEPYLLKDGDILFARSGATVGKTFLYKEQYGESAFAGYLIKASVDTKKHVAQYVYYYTQGALYDQWKNSSYSQATIQNIGADKYSELIIPVPPLEEQQVIVEVLNKKMSYIDSLISELRSQIEDLKSYKQSLITEAVTGQVDVRDWTPNE